MIYAIFRIFDEAHFQISKKKFILLFFNSPKTDAVGGVADETVLNKVHKKETKNP
jgi:hypothetical protein